MSFCKPQNVYYDRDDVRPMLMLVAHRTNLMMCASDSVRRTKIFGRVTPEGSRMHLMLVRRTKIFGRESRLRDGDSECVRFPMYGKLGGESRLFDGDCGCMAVTVAV